MQKWAQRLHSHLPFDDVQTSHLCENAGSSQLAELTKFDAVKQLTGSDEHYGPFELRILYFSITIMH